MDGGNLKANSHRNATQRNVSGVKEPLNIVLTAANVGRRQSMNINEAQPARVRN